MPRFFQCLLLGVRGYFKKLDSYYFICYNSGGTGKEVEGGKEQVLFDFDYRVYDALLDWL